MAASANHYSAYGLHWRSELALPFRPAAAARRADVTVRSGDVVGASILPGAGKGLWSHDSTGVFRMNVPRVARYRVEKGAAIVVDPAGGGDADVRTFLLGSVLAACLQQRGIVTLHASAVAVDGGAVLFAGGSGAGKSSLAAAFVERGYGLLADDVAGVVVDRERRATALPAFPRLRLWEDALDGPGGGTRTFTRVRDELEKYEVPVERFHADPLPVRAVFVLSSHGREAIETATLPPARAFESLVARTYRRRFMNRAGRQGHFGTLAALAGQAAVVRAGRPGGLPCVGALADELERRLRVDARGQRDAARAAAGRTPKGDR